MRKFLFAAVLLAVLAALFISSGQTYEQQTLIPQLKERLPGKPLEGLLSRLEIPYWGKTISVEERGYYHFIEFLLRKAAHFFTFGLLCIAIYFTLPRWKLRTLLALFLIFLAASADEFHQSLTGGRTPTMQDVILDMAGAVVCLAVVRIVLWLYSRIQTRVKKS